MNVFIFRKKWLTRKDSKDYDLFDDTYREFAAYIHNGALVEEKIKEYFYRRTL